VVATPRQLKLFFAGFCCRSDHNPVIFLPLSRLLPIDLVASLSQQTSILLCFVVLLQDMDESEFDWQQQRQDMRPLIQFVAGNMLFEKDTLRNMQSSADYSKLSGVNGLSLNAYDENDESSKQTPLPQIGEYNTELRKQKIERAKVQSLLFCLREVLNFTFACLICL
jgi:hypothetical protein